MRALLPCLALLSALAAPASAQDALAGKVFPDPAAAALAEAAAAGDAEQVRALAAEGADVDARGDQGTTLLHWALLNQSPDGLAALLEAGADPTPADDSGRTVVHLVALAEDPAYLEILLAHGADPDTANAVTGATPLVDALIGTRDQQFAMLLAAGANPGGADRMGDTPLHQAAKINAHDRVLDLLEAGAPPDARNAQGVSFQRFLFMTPENVLSDEARAGRAEIIAWLESHGIAVDRGG